MSVRQQSVESLEAAINRAAASAEQNEGVFGQAELGLLERCNKQSRDLGLDNSHRLRTRLVRVACLYARKVLEATQSPQPVYLDGLINVMANLDYADGYGVAHKVRLSAHLALLAALKGEDTIADEAGKKAAHRSAGLDGLVRASVLLVRSEVISPADQDRPLLEALEIVKRISNSKDALLLELLTRERLTDYYSHFRRPVRSQWHAWHNRGLKKRLKRRSDYRQGELQDARLQRVPLPLRYI